MTPPQQPQRPNQTILGAITQAVHTVQAKVNFTKLVLKPNSKVPELWVQESDADKAEVYPLIGDRYTLGRSSKSCDIVVRNPVVSQVHLSLIRSGARQKSFIIKDENSTNGIYKGRRRVTAKKLRHGEILTLGPPELAASVRVQYVDPPPLYAVLANRALYGIGAVTALVGLYVGIEWTKFSVRPLPNATGGPVIVYAGDGETPLRQPRNNAHVELRLSEFSPYLPKAVVASEDKRYYWHMGVDPIGILRATFIISRGGDRQGGSTVTQQVARSLFRDYVGPQDSLGRKLREAIVSLKLETFYSKDTILETYLNRVFLGIDAYGFDDASRYYFDKSAKDLSLEEAATLVGILPAPNNFDPCDNASRQRAIRIRNGVIARMLAQGLISREEANQGRRSLLEVSPKVCEERARTIAPYFYSYVFEELKALLGEEIAREGNFIVQTALDPRLQRLAETSLRNAIATSGSSNRFSQGAILTLNSSNGAIVALAGGVDYRKSQFNRATQALRQPGSTFKIFAYAAAIEQGISPGNSYSCAPLIWQGQRYRGCERASSARLDMYTGIALSENAIALRVAQDAGLDRVVDMAQRLGVKSKLEAVPGLVLGQSVVHVLEMTGAFAAIANRGVLNRPHAIVRILDSSSCKDRNDLTTCRVIYSQESSSQANQRVLSQNVANTMDTLLRGVVQAGTGRPAALGLGVAGKTGTTNDNVDLWFIGYIPTRQVVTGIWLGNDDNSPTSGSSAQAAQLWGNYMGKAVNR
jgi:penicillin-binding protein 1A